VSRTESSLTSRLLSAPSPKPVKRKRWWEEEEGLQRVLEETGFFLQL
jgi:hypothetical protein